MDAARQVRAWRSQYRKRVGTMESPCGIGSFMVNTKEVRDALPRIFREYDVLTLTDVPCGDWNWMQFVDLRGVDYVGLDAVPEIIGSNRHRFPGGVRFEVFNAVEEVPRRSDLILCRDFMFHLSNEFALKVICNFKASGSRLLLATSFDRIDVNRNLKVKGAIGWRQVNLNLAPFCLPCPLEVIQENESHACQGRILGLYDMTEWEPRDGDS